jgi:hypothetical protein
MYECIHGPSFDRYCGPIQRHRIERLDLSCAAAYSFIVDLYTCARAILAGFLALIGVAAGIIGVIKDVDARS